MTISSRVDDAATDLGKPQALIGGETAVTSDEDARGGRLDPAATLRRNLSKAPPPQLTILVKGPRQSCFHPSGLRALRSTRIE
jgi:hypothetical protein